MAFPFRRGKFAVWVASLVLGAVAGFSAWTPHPLLSGRSQQAGKKTSA
uniref:Uncharacterized protein n=1 Tax=Desertifilum tharense IPPAS B-1220 TaxID=1781255 RepID=A0ACD5H2R1_9CYAN